MDAPVGGCGWTAPNRVDWSRHAAGLQFSTRRYCDNPLSVQSSGAGPEVTADGVFTDLLRAAESLEARA